MRSENHESLSDRHQISLSTSRRSLEGDWVLMAKIQRQMHEKQEHTSIRENENGQIARNGAHLCNSWMNMSRYYTKKALYEKKSAKYLEKEDFPLGPPTLDFVAVVRLISKST